MKDNHLLLESIDTPESRSWYQDVDADLTIKNLLFSFFFILLVFVIMLYLIIPRIRDYKLAFNAYSKQEVAYSVAQKKFNAVQMDLASLAQSSQSELNKLKLTTSSREISDFLQKFFIAVNVKSEDSYRDEENQLLQTTFEIEVLAKDLKALRGFFTAIKDSPTNLKINIPFVIKKQDDGLFISFQLVSKKTLYKMLH